jgi:hypothetical protein
VVTWQKGEALPISGPKVSQQRNNWIAERLAFGYTRQWRSIR